MAVHIHQHGSQVDRLAVSAFDSPLIATPVRASAARFDALSFGRANQRRRQIDNRIQVSEESCASALLDVLQTESTVTLEMLPPEVKLRLATMVFQQLGAVTDFRLPRQG